MSKGRDYDKWYRVGVKYNWDWSVLGESDFNELVADCHACTGTFLRTMMSGFFYRPFGRAHDQFLEVLDDPHIQTAVFEAPRGIGKTTFLLIGYAAKQLVYRRKRFIMPVAASADDAEEKSENLKEAIATNANLVYFFGELKSEFRADKFSKKQWVTAAKQRVFPRGQGQKTRGRLHVVRQRAIRPDLVLGDDIEDPEAITTDMHREKVWKWFMRAVRGVVTAEKRGLYVDEDGYDNAAWEMYIMGTPTYEDSIIEHLKDMSDWTSVKIELFNKNFQSNYPEYMDDGQILAKYREFEEGEDIQGFFREFGCQLLPGGMEAFRKSMFKHYIETESELNDDPRVCSFVIIDPAKTLKSTSHPSAIAGGSINVDTNRLLFREGILGKMEPNALYDASFDMAIRLRARIIGVEKTSLEAFIMQPMQNQLERRGLAGKIKLIPLQAVGSKEERWMSLRPYYADGLVEHSPAYADMIEPNLLGVPKPKGIYKHMLDCWAYVPSLLAEEHLYMRYTEDSNFEKSYQDPRKIAAEYASIGVEDDHMPAFSKGSMGMGMRAPLRPFHDTSPRLVQHAD